MGPGVSLGYVPSMQTLTAVWGGWLAALESSDQCVSVLEGPETWQTELHYAVCHRPVYCS